MVTRRPSSQGRLPGGGGTVPWFEVVDGGDEGGNSWQGEWHVQRSRSRTARMYHDLLDKKEPGEINLEGESKLFLSLFPHLKIGILVLPSHL